MPVSSQATAYYMASAQYKEASMIVPTAGVP